MTRPAQKPTRPGRALRWTPEELDALSAIGPEDIAAAQALTRRASPHLAALLDAEEVLPDPPEEER